MRTRRAGADTGLTAPTVTGAVNTAAARAVAGPRLTALGGERTRRAAVLRSRFAAIMPVTLAGVLVAATPALAHTTLISAVPGKNATVATLTQIKLTYADPVRFPRVVVMDASGGRHESGRPYVVDNTVTEKVAGPLAPGVYTVGWRVVAPDGHPVTGDYHFTVRAASASAPPVSAGTTPGVSPSTPSAAGSPSVSPVGQSARPSSSAGWWWIGLALLVLGAAGGGLAVLRRRPRRNP
jgi:methionine-rich copper-binding protein CopC